MGEEAQSKRIRMSGGEMQKRRKRTRLLEKEPHHLVEAPHQQGHRKYRGAQNPHGKKRHGQEQGAQGDGQADDLEEDLVLKKHLC